MKAVIDTNVFVSYLIAPRGAGAWLLALWNERKFELVISITQFEELVAVLNRSEPLLHVDPQRKLALFRRLRNDAVWVSGSLDASGSLPDPHDDFLIAAAQEASASWLVTWDKALLNKTTSRQIGIINPDQFISLLIRGEI